MAPAEFDGLVVWLFVCFICLFVCLVVPGHPDGSADLQKTYAGPS